MEGVEASAKALVSGDRLLTWVCSFNCVNGVNDSWQIKILP